MLLLREIGFFLAPHNLGSPRFCAITIATNIRQNILLQR